MHIYIYIYIYIYTYTYTCIYIYIYIYRHTQIRTCMWVVLFGLSHFVDQYKCMEVYMHVYVCVYRFVHNSFHAQKKRVYKNICTDLLYTFVFVCILDMHAFIRGTHHCTKFAFILHSPRLTYIPAYMHIHTCACIVHMQLKYVCTVNNVSLSAARSLLFYMPSFMYTYTRICETYMHM